MGFSTKLTGLIETRNLSARAVAVALDVSPSTVGRWMGGESKITLEDVLRLADYFDVPLSALVDDPRAQQPTTLTDDEAYVLRTIRNLGVSGDFVVQAIRTRMKPLQVEQGEAVQVESDPDPDELRGPGGGNPGPVSVRRRPI